MRGIELTAWSPRALGSTGTARQTIGSSPRPRTASSMT